MNIWIYTKNGKRGGGYVIIQLGRHQPVSPSKRGEIHLQKNMTHSLNQLYVVKALGLEHIRAGALCLLPGVKKGTKELSVPLPVPI